MVRIARLKPDDLKPGDLRRLISGYTSSTRYQVSRFESAEYVTFALELVQLPSAYVKRFDHLDEATLAHYGSLPAAGFCFGAFDGPVCVGIALAERGDWNNSLLLWELHVAQMYRGRGIGQQLVVAVAEAAQAAGLRTLVAETQNSNVPAIGFYRRQGFRLEGIDLSYYSNEDFPDGEIALFMKKRLV